MKITYATKRQEVTSEFVASAERKLKKFDKFFKDDATALIKTDKKRGFESVELTISCGGTLYRSEKRADTMMNALDETIEAILRQIRKNKTRLERRLKSGAFESGILETGEDFEEEPEFNIRRKSFSIKPMSVEEAIMQMNLLGHEFFVFRDAQSEEICVVYKRHGNTYGLIEDKPE